MATTAQTISLQPLHAVSSLRVIKDETVTSNPMHLDEETMQLAPGPDPTQSTMHHDYTTTSRALPSTQAAAVPEHTSTLELTSEPSEDESNSNPFCTAKKTTKNILATLGLLLTLVFGIAAYRDMQWSEHTNAVQTCASLYVGDPIYSRCADFNLSQSIGQFTEFCNTTIEAGVDSTPLVRRWKVGEYIPIHRHGVDDYAIDLTLTILLTTAAVLFGVSYSRPRMKAFTPFISHARLHPPTWIPGTRFIAESGCPKCILEWLHPRRSERRDKNRDFDGSECTTEAETDQVSVLEPVNLCIKSIASSTSSGCLPQVRNDHPKILELWEKKVHVKWCRDHLMKLYSEHREARSERRMTYDCGSHPDLPDANFEAEFEERFKLSQDALAAAEQGLSVAYMACITTGLGSEGFCPPPSLSLD